MSQFYYILTGIFVVVRYELCFYDSTGRTVCQAHQGHGFNIQGIHTPMNSICTVGNLHGVDKHRPASDLNSQPLAWEEGVLARRLKLTGTASTSLKVSRSEV